MEGEEERVRLEAGDEAAHRKMSTSGTSLYQLLGLEKGAEPDEIKKAYRRLALRYHPDKNPNDPSAGEKFKEISYANGILSDETKKQIYDAYGSMGIHMAEQVGEENFAAYVLMSNKWVKAFFVCCGIFTGCYCCCCCCLCCFCCCGRCGPKPEMDEDADFRISPDDIRGAGNNPLPQGGGGNTSESTPIVVTEQPSPSYKSTDPTPLPYPDSASPIAMPPPPSAQQSQSQPGSKAEPEPEPVEESSASLASNDLDYSESPDASASSKLRPNPDSVNTDV